MSTAVANNLSISLIVPQMNRGENINNRMKSAPPSPLSTSKTSPPSTLSLLQPGTPRNFKKSLSTPVIKTRRVSLGQGCGMLDWIKLCRNTEDMAGTGGDELIVTEDELARHCTIEDAWTCIRGKVYNITPYFKFHPGGIGDLLKGAGKDSTMLFDEAHKWVNVESMLKKCYVGTIMYLPKRDSIRPRSDSLSVPKPKIIIDGINRNALPRRECEYTDDATVHTPQSPIHPTLDVTSEETDSSAIVVIPPSPVRKNSDASRPTMPYWDWNQTDDNINIQVVYTHNRGVQESDIVLDVDGKSFEAAIKFDGWIYQMDIALLHPVTHPKVFVHTTKVEFRLTKSTPHTHWKNIGNILPGHGQMVSEANREMKFRNCEIQSVTSVTHDTKIFTLSLPSTCHISVPIGHHVALTPIEPGNDVERSYTPIENLITPDLHQDSNQSDIQLMIKLYKDGVMSKHLSTLKTGDHIRVGDPQGTFEVDKLEKVNDLVLIAAGTGFTPMIRVLNRFLTLPESSSKRNVQLIFANKTERDIAMRTELDNLAKEYKCLKITHILSTPDEHWNGLRGRVNVDLLKTHLPSPEKEQDGLLVCVCGPLPFTAGISDILMDMNYSEESVHLFQ